MKDFLFVIRYMNLIKKKNLLILRHFCQNASQTGYIFACRQINVFMRKWMKIQYLSRMLNTNYCFPHEKTRKHVYMFVYVSFGEEKIKTKMCNAAFKLWAKKREIKETWKWRQRREECTKESKILPILKWRWLIMCVLMKCKHNRLSPYFFIRQSDIDTEKCILVTCWEEANKISHCKWYIYVS